MTPASARDVATLVQEESARLREFVAVLVEEGDILAGNQLERLLTLAEQKSALARTIADLDDQRLKAVGATAANAEAGMAAWLAGVANPELQRQWQETLRLAAQARELNALNGRLIAERLRHNQQALAILVGANEQASLYGPDGQPRLAGGGRPLGSA